MSPINPHQDTGTRLLRGIAAIVLVGAALGIAHNAVLLRSHSPRALAWWRSPVPLAILEDGGPAAAQESSPASPPAPAGPARRAAPTPSSPPASNSPAGTPRGQSGVMVQPVATVRPPEIPDSTEPREARLEIAKTLFDAGAAVFVDARDVEEFAEGHIPGAVSLPFDAVFQDPSLAGRFADGGRPIVIYCGGGECESSKNLGFALAGAGRRKVLVLTGGLPEWRRAGYPVERGAPGGSS